MKEIKALSKSKIIAYRQCEKRLWLEVHRPELREDSAATQANFASGNRVGEIAQQLYNVDGTGELVDFMEVGFEQAFQKSAELLTSRQIIFEAGMRAGGALAFADVMLPVNKRGKIKWKMIEVKGSTSVKDYYRDDVALQCYVAKEQGINIDSVSLAHIDNQWVYPGGENYKGLLKEEDLTQEALARHEEAKEWVEQAHKIIKKKQAPNIDIGEQCNKPYACGFYDYCAQDYDFPEQPVTWLPRIQSKKFIEAIDSGEVASIAEAPNELLNDLQKRVKDVTLSGKPFFDKQAAKAALEPQLFPAYFLDFESIQFAVPIWKGTRPFEQLVFQYSVHVVNKNLQVSHKEFLEVQGQDPLRACAEQLIKDCGKQGPIYVYSRGFEGSRIKDFASKFPDLSKELLAIEKRLFDLLPLARNVFYHPSQQGSWSIKKVLPALIPTLKHSNLEGVQDGGEAQMAYLEMIDANTSSERKAQLEKQLLAYCKLDTWAMVKIWEKFSGNKLSNLSS